MRWEWRDAIRYLDWQQLEDFTKHQACAELADTIYELCIGLDKKEDIRAAKRLLFQLEQKGFSPRQNDGPVPVQYEAPNAGKFGVLSTTDWEGTHYMSVIHTAGKKARILRASVNHTGLYCAVGCSEFPFSQLHRLRPQLMLEADRERKAFKVSAEYILNRIAWYRQFYGLVKDTSTNREPLEKVSPYWDRLLDACPREFSTLVAGLPEASMQSVDVSSYWLEHPHAKQWRLIVGAKVYRQLMPELRRIEAHSKSEEEKMASRLDYLKSSRKELIPEFFSFDYSMRFHDLAALAVQQQDDVTAQLCMRCHGEIGRTGVSHPFFDRLIEKTAEDLSKVAANHFSDQRHFLFRAPVAAAA